MPTDIRQPSSDSMASETTPFLSVTNDQSLMDMLNDDPMTLNEGMIGAAKREPKRPSVARRSILGELKSASPTVVAPVDRVTKLQEQYYADDLELPPEAYTKWSDEELVAFFENGGFVPAPRVPAPSVPRAAAVPAKPASATTKVETQTDNVWPYFNMASESIFSAMGAGRPAPEGSVHPNIHGVSANIWSNVQVPDQWPMSNLAEVSIFRAMAASC